MFLVDTITDIQAHPTSDDYLLSASKDGSVRMWNIVTGKCLFIFEFKASVVVRRDSGVLGHHLNCGAIIQLTKIYSPLFDDSVSIPEPRVVRS